MRFWIVLWCLVFLPKKLKNLKTFFKTSRFFPALVIFGAGFSCCFLPVDSLNLDSIICQLSVTAWRLIIHSVVSVCLLSTFVTKVSQKLFCGLLCKIYSTHSLHAILKMVSFWCRIEFKTVGFWPFTFSKLS